MAEPLNMAGMCGLTDPGLCTLEASCATGFEPVVLEEVKDMLGCEGRVHQGRVIFDLACKRAKEALRLRTVNNIWVLVGHTSKFDYPPETGGQLLSLENYADQLDWSKALEVWKDVMNFKGDLYPKLKDKENLQKDAENNVESGDGEDLDNRKARLENIPSFRCTCYRSGTNHKFKSTEAQYSVGGRIQDKFGWNVKMKEYDIEVVINCDVDQVYISIALTNKSLFNRTLSHLGSLCLKPTIAAALVRLAKVKPGDIVLDPMCGGGTIPLEGSQLGTGGFFIGGEIHPGGVERCNKNMRDITTLHNLTKVPEMDCLQWSALHPCLRENSVDVVVSDLPFGKRSGSKADNRVLYPTTMLAMARIVKPETGRAVLLTQDKTSMFKSFGKIQKFWRLDRYFGVNIGGLHGLVFVFKRTAEVWSKSEKQS